MLHPYHSTLIAITMQLNPIGHKNPKRIIDILHLANPNHTPYHVSMAYMNDIGALELCGDANDNDDIAADEPHL